LFRFGFFFYGAAVILRSRKLIPVVLCGVVLLGVLAAAFLAYNFEDLGPLRRLEWITYDWRVREAAKREAPVASNLGLVFVNEASIWYMRSGSAGYDDDTRFEASLYWPRHVYGQVVEELDKQGVDVVGFDILLGDLRPKTETVKLPGNAEERSDSYFANQVAHSGRVVLAAQNQIVPPPWFRTNAWAIGDIGTMRDFDGVLRRAKAFEDYVVFEPFIEEAHQVIEGFVFDTNRVLFPQASGTPAVLPIEPDGTFEMAKLFELVKNEKFPPGVNRKGLAFRRMRVWDLGIVMAAHYLGIDLNAAKIIPGKSIEFRGTNDLRREIAIDKENRFYIDWSLEHDDSRIHREAFHSLLDRHYKRTVGKTNDIEIDWRGRVALVGSVALGNDLTDIGSTPLGREAYLTMRYLNIANSMLVNRFVQQPSFPLQLALIIALGLFSGIFTWNFRVHFAALCVILLACAYTALALYLFIESRYWMPLVLPIGGLLAVHMALVTYRVAVEQQERRRIRSIFSKIVSPNVVNELLQADTLALAGVRREITVFFSDVRGFTEMTDESHARAEEHVKAHRLSVVAAEAYFDEQAHEILQTVNLYLGTIADVVKKSEGTLDKYIGDCVMAFWGAPTPNEKHAVSCVRAALEAQRAIDLLNTERTVENARRERENKERASQALPQLPLLKILTMGAGINTGIVTLGLMGSEQHVYNYTVFGRDVNLAARLEGLSGRGRILIGEATYRALLRDDPTLAGTCRELEPATVKGFRTPVKVYEVPWRNTASVEASPRMTQPAEAPPATAP
jgi:class 3 adenylate cyclase/CHASE2 domain-containing sensor protein